MYELELYFDRFIASNSSWTEEEEEKKEEEEEKDGDMELLLSLLPEELLTSFSEENSGTSGIFMSPEHSTSLDSNSQNAAEVPVEEEEKEEELSKIIVTIHNVVGTMNLDFQLDLHFIASNAWNVEHDPNKFLGLIMRIKKPRVTALLYKSGKIVIIGAKSEALARLASRRCLRKLQRIGVPVSFTPLKIHNVMATGNTHALQLEDLQRAHKDHCNYEPELFPALQLYLKPGLSLSIFSSGALLLTGSKSEAEVQEVFESLRPLLGRFRRGATTTE